MLMSFHRLNPTIPQLCYLRMDPVVLLIGSLILAYWMIRNMSLIHTKYPLWNDEFKEVKDPRLFWDLMKYKIRQESIFYSKMKAK